VGPEGKKKGSAPLTNPFIEIDAPKKKGGKDSVSRRFRRPEGRGTKDKRRKEKERDGARWYSHKLLEITALSRKRKKGRYKYLC